MSSPFYVNGFTTDKPNRSPLSCFALEPNHYKLELALSVAVTRCVPRVSYPGRGRSLPGRREATESSFLSMGSDCAVGGEGIWAPSHARNWLG